LQAELGDDALDATGADGLAGLTYLLGYDGGVGVRVQKAVADDLLADLVGATRGGFGATLLTLEGQSAAGLEGLAELEIALFAEAKLTSGGQGAGALALAFKEHGQFEGDFVGGEHGQVAGRAAEGLGGGVSIKCQHEQKVGAGEMKV
jgi:hypothetical protein